MSPTIETVVAAVTAVLAGLCLAATGVLQQRAARRRPSSERGTLRLIAHLARDRSWWVGVGVAAVSYGFQAIALTFGSLTLVQPLIVSELLFAIPFATRLRGRRLGGRDWAAIAAVVSGLSIGIVAADPRRGNSLPPSSTWAWALLAIAGVAALAALGARLVSGPVKASGLALAGAVILGTQSALYSSTLRLLGHAGLAVFASWHPYVLIVGSLLGGYLVQNAYQAGPLAASMPVMDATLPLTSIGLGVGLFGEAVRTSVLGLAGAGVGIALLVIGIVLLDTSPAVRRLDETEQREQDSDQAHDP